MVEPRTVLLTNDWLLPFLGGVGATVVGFVLTMIWDVWKRRGEKRQRDATITRAIDDELAEDVQIVETDLSILGQEIAALADGNSVVGPLLPVKTGFWDIARISPPAALLKGEGLIRLRDVSYQAHVVNEYIRSRETYRIHNGAMSNFSTRMGLYDESLLQVLEAQKMAIAKYQSIPPQRPRIWTKL